MWAKIVVFVLWLGLCGTISVVWNSAVQPEVVSDVAMRQFEPSDAVAVQMRGISRLSAIAVGVSAVIFILGSLLIFKAEITKLVKSAADAVKEEG